MHYRVMVIVCIFWVVEGVSSLGAAEQHMMQPRVPADKLAEARSLTSPFPDSPETVEKGESALQRQGDVRELPWSERSRRWSGRRILESCPSEFSPAWVLASSYGG